MSFHSVVEKQRAYFNTGKTKSIQERISNLQTLRKLVEDNTEQLCDAVYKDHRRLPANTFFLEISNTIQEIDYTIANLKEWAQPTYVDKTVVNALDQPMIVKDPLGVVLIISPWNYPVAMLTLPLVPAIAAGNTVILKPSEVSSNTAAAIEELFAKYFPAEYISVVNGGVTETTELLKERFDHIFYTGCPPVAKIIMAAAAKHLTPVTLELGGKCPVIVEDDVDLDISARRIAWGKWMNCGQTCLAPDYILVSEKSKPKLIEGFRKYLKEFYGSEMKESKDYSRIISQRHYDRISSLLEQTKGTVLFSGGERDRDDLFIPPTILDVHVDDPFMQDEIFGPVLPVVTVKDLSEAIDFINKGEKPLAAYIFTSNEAKAKRLYSETSSGGVTINDVIMHITVDTLPFGGVGTSGMGRYRGKYGFDTFSHEKSVLKRGFFGEALQAARYPPMSEKKLNNLKMLTGKRIGMPGFVGWIGRLPVIVLSIVFGMFMQKYLRAIR
ncbi:unnamed protein product [Auanema sp. JU1783]|nr:unnamed protein product [Auanema sp. JU1783]